MINEDLSVYFGTDDFAETLTIGGTDFVGIWDEPYIEDLDVESQNPSFTTPGDVSVLNHGDTTQRNGITYELVEVRPDGSGVTSLFFHKA